MEIGPILRTLVHARARFLLIALEVALTLAIVVNCVHLASELRRTMTRPSGLDEENLLAVRVRPFAAAYRDAAHRRAARDADLERVRRIPGVLHTAGFNALPLSGGGSATGRIAEGSTRDPISVPYFVATEDALETLGVELVAGRDFAPEEHLSDVDSPVILTQTLADKLFPEGDALGKRLTTSRADEHNTVVGIVRRMVNSWPQSDAAEDTALFPGADVSPDYYVLLVHTRPEAKNEVEKALAGALLERDGGRGIEVRALTDVRAETFSSDRVTMRILGMVVVLLVVVTSLGIVGLTSFSVTQRTRQIGTRRALGATRVGVLRYFLVENGIVSGTGLVAGAVFAYLLNGALMRFTDATRLEAPLLVAGAAGLLAASLLAALPPALRAARVPPVVATRSM